LTGQLHPFLDNLRTLSGIDCGTHNKAGVDTVGAWVQARCTANGWQSLVHQRTHAGNIVEATVFGRGSRRLGLLAHMDTVYPDGVAEQRPLRIEGDTVLGPGTADMKAGLLAGIYAVEALQESLDDLPFGEIVLLFTSDEETGSAESRGMIEALARRCDAVLVLEAARASGAIVAARKGVSEYTVTVHGRSAHAGVEPEKGRNAILALAHKIVALHALNGTIADVTVNVGVVRGGTATNVVPDTAIAQVEARAFTPDALHAVDARIREIVATPDVPDTTITLAARPSFPPMPRTEAIERLAREAQAVAGELGFSVEAVSTGGGSDASLVAGVGTPVLDGLGPIGGDDHSPREWVSLSSIVPRVTMLAGLLVRLSAGAA
jgi:glutamate carboxypeptidase